MRATLAHYTNDIVSLLVMALMSIALIAGQAGQAGQAGAAQHVASEQTDGAAAQVLVIDVDLKFRQEGE